MKKITKQTYLDWYKDMLFWRKFEDKLASVYIQQKVRGFLHLYNGQEAILAGALHAMDLSKDKMITAYRNHVQPIGMGEDPKKVMAELYGKVTGTSKGMGGSMHIFSKEFGFYGGHGIVGGQIPLGAGIAFGDKYKGSDAVTLTCFVIVQLDKVLCMKLLIWQCCGNYRLFLLLKTMDMPWELQ